MSRIDKYKFWVIIAAIVFLAANQFIDKDKIVEIVRPQNVPQIFASEMGGLTPLAAGLPVHIVADPRANPMYADTFFVETYATELAALNGILLGNNTDYFPTLQAAIDSLKGEDADNYSDGGTILLPPGRYLLSDSISVENMYNFAMIGSGWNTIIYADTSFDSLKNMFHVNAGKRWCGLDSIGTSKDKSFHKVLFKDIRFCMNDQGGKTRENSNVEGKARHIYNTRNEWVASAAYGNIMYVTGQIWDMSIESCVFDSAHFCGIKVNYDSAGYYYWETGQVSNCVFRDINGTAISMYFGGPNTVNANTFRHVGIAIMPKQVCSIVGNEFHEIDSVGIYIFSAWNRVINNKFSEGGGPAICLDNNADANIIMGNTGLNGLHTDMDDYKYAWIELRCDVTRPGGGANDMYPNNNIICNNIYWSGQSAPYTGIYKAMIMIEDNKGAEKNYIFQNMCDSASTNKTLFYGDADSNYVWNNWTAADSFKVPTFGLAGSNRYFTSIPVRDSSGVMHYIYIQTNDSTVVVTQTKL